MSTLVESKRLHLTSSAYQFTREAYTRLKLAGAVHAAAKLKATLKSLEGAVRHAQRLQNMDIPPNRRIRVHRRPVNTLPRRYVGQCPYCHHYGTDCHCHRRKTQPSVCR